MGTETLTAYAARLLAGTGLDTATATAVANGSASAPGVAAAALRDGYSAPERVDRPIPYNDEDTDQ